MSGVSALLLIIAQCDDYFDRTLCCVEAMMIQMLRSHYNVHEWFEQVGCYTRQEEEGEDDEDDENDREEDKEDEEEGEEEEKEWILQKVQSAYHLTMTDKDLSHESDRPKVLFLERQTGLLGRYSARRRGINNNKEKWSHVWSSANN